MNLGVMVILRVAVALECLAFATKPIRHGTSTEPMEMYTRCRVTGPLTVNQKSVGATRRLGTTSPPLVVCKCGYTRSFNEYGHLSR